MVSKLRKILGNMSSISPQEKPLDANKYATKKTIAQGMLDIALLTANASQLKYILQVGHKHEFYTLMLGLITTSIILQIGVGILFLIIGGLDLNKQNDRQPAVILNDIILIMVFLITTLNVVISGFGIQHTSTGPFTYRFNVLLGIASLISARININLQENKTRAAWWHHIAVCCITLGVIADILKMSFSVDSNFTPDRIVV